jgi:hypothetical protein
MEAHYTVATNTEGDRFVFLQGPFPTYEKALYMLQRSVLLLYQALPTQTRDLSFTVASIDAAGRQPTVMFPKKTANAQEIANI